MILAVLDTNVLASGFVGFADADRAPGQLLRLWRDRRFSLVVSEDILTELRNTFMSAYFQRRLSPEHVAAAEQLLRQEAVMTSVHTHLVGVAAHPEDDLVLAAAISAQAAYLVTGDGPLLRLGNYAGVDIVSPRQFLTILQVDSARNGQ